MENREFYGGGGKALHFIPRCLQSVLSYCLELRFGPEKLINPTFFAAGGNDTFAPSGHPPSPHLKTPGSPRVPHCRFL